MARKNALTKRNANYYVSKQKSDKELKSARSSKARALAKVREYKSPGKALGNSALMLGGAAAAGVVRAYQPQVGQMPTDMSLALIAITAGVFTKQSSLVYLGTGAASAFVGGYAQEQAEMYLYGTGSVAVPATSTGGN